MNTDVFQNMQNALKEKVYHSRFDFEKYNIDEQDKAYIIYREQIICDNVKKYSSSLYEICKALYEIKMTLKGDENSQSFVEWYTSNGLNKDKISELMKRYELYIQVPEAIPFISGLSIPAVKELTKKNVDVDVQIEAIEKGLSNVEDIRNFIESKKPLQIEHKEKKEISKQAITLTNFYTKKINSQLENSELAKYKKEIHDLRKFLKQLENDIEKIEDFRAKENNLKLSDNI